MVLFYVLFILIVIVGLYLFRFSKTRYNPKKPNLQQIQTERPLQVVITGGSKGVGYALAKKFLEVGDYVIICSRSQQGVDQAVARLRQETKVLYSYYCIVNNFIFIYRLEFKYIWKSV